MNLSRRELLRHASAAALVSAAPALSACRGVTRGDFRDADEAPLGFSASEAALLRLAALAPSGHNAQPWTVTAEGPGRWRVGSTRERWLPAVDPQNRELALSLGAFAENLAQAAPMLGLHAGIEATGRSASDETVFTVQLTSGSGGADTRDRIERRCTVRDGLADETLRDGDRHWLEEHAPGRVHVFPRGTEQAEYLRRATSEASAAQGARADAREELAEWIHWSDEEARAARNGLTPEAMGIRGIGGWYVRHFFGRDTVLDPDFAASSAERAHDQAAQGGGWIVITSPGGTVPELIEAGRLCERIWLGVRERGAGLHPMSAALEEAPWDSELPKALDLPGAVQFVLRAGYVSGYPEPASLRMPLRRFVHTA